MEISFTLQELAVISEDITIEGSVHKPITGIASLEEARSGDLAFLGNPKYAQAVKDSRASVIFLPDEYKGGPRAGQVYLRTSNPSLAFARVTQRLEHKLWPEVPPGIHPTAVLHGDAQIDASAHVGPLCVIAEGAVIGGDTFLQSGIHVGRHVSIGPSCRLLAGAIVQDYCELGREVILQPGCVIGSDGYGYETEDGRHLKVPQIGRVVLEDNVEVGANTTIDRARFQETRIGAGTKIDNLVQIGHNVRVGSNCLIVAQVAIGGSTVLDENVVIGGQAGLAGHLRIGPRTSIAGQSGVSRNLESGEVVRGTPSLPIATYHRMTVLQKRLPEFYKRLKKLEQICDPNDSQ